ncbi:MAG: glutathione peroxidase [Bacteroidales bacterium]
MKAIVLSMLIMFSLTAAAQTSFYDLKAKTIEGEDFDFATLKGKKVLIVNTASKCGYTPQYKDLEALYQKYQSKGLVILGFPANNFLKQEPGTDKEIQEFCTKNYGVTFQMMSKISVKGDDMHPVYQWLTQKSRNGVSDSEISWNFQKYLIEPEGYLFKTVSTKVKPDSEEIISWIIGE